MKLIIDIDDSDYSNIVEQVKKNDYPDMHIGRTIINGTHVSTEGDLISREALKEDFKTRLEKAKNWKENALNKGDEELVIRATATIDFICEVIMTINNAPTVDTFTFDDMKKGINVGYKAGRLTEKWERPQGKWICPNCDFYDHVEDDYCQYAGECTIGCRECKYFKQKGGT